MANSGLSMTQKKGEFNLFTTMGETICTIGTDWIAEAASVLQRKHFERGDETEGMECTVSIMDLPDAYRGGPCHPEDARFSYTAVHVPDHNCWKFLKLDSFAHGLMSAVVSFNRLRTLVVAAVRRMTCVLASAFFDDLVTLDRVSARHTGNAALHKLLSFVGARAPLLMSVQYFLKESYAPHPKPRWSKKYKSWFNQLWIPSNSHLETHPSIVVARSGPPVATLHELEFGHSNPVTTILQTPMFCLKFLSLLCYTTAKTAWHCVQRCFS